MEDEDRRNDLDDRITTMSERSNFEVINSWRTKEEWKVRITWRCRGDITSRGGGNDERRKPGIRSVAGELWVQVGGGRSTPGVVGNQVTARSLSHPPSSVPPRRQIKRTTLPSARSLAN